MNTKIINNLPEGGRKPSLLLCVEFGRLLGALFMLILLFVATAKAQRTVTGMVVDSANQQGLVEALVKLKGSDLATSTNERGQFTLTNLPNEKFTLVISYVGCYDEEITFNSSSNVRNIRVEMRFTSHIMNTVVIGGIASQQIKALVDMKKADNIVNIVSAEQIVTFPDLNAAEVLQRVPGITLMRDQGEGRYVQLRGTPPQFTNFTINGEQVSSPEGSYRYIGMDIIPSDQIERIEVTKVLTPDMDGDAIGGAVNIVTKTHKSSQPTFSMALASGYNNLRQVPLYNGQLSFGAAYKKLSVQVNASYFQNNQGADNIEYKFIKGPFFNGQDDGRDNYHLHFREAQLRHYTIQRTRMSVSPSFVFDLNKNHSFYIKSMFNRFTDDEVRRRLIYDLEDPLDENYFLYGGIKHDLKDRTKYQDLYTSSIGGKHKFRRWKVDYQMFYSFAQEQEPDRVELSFDSPGQAVAIKFEDMDTDFPKATFPNEQNATNATDYTNYDFDELLFEDSKTRELLLTPRFNLQYTYKKDSNQLGIIKLGGKLRSRVKSRNVVSNVLGAYRVTSNLYPGMGDTLRLTGVSDGFYTDNLLGQGYTMSNMPNAMAINEFYEFFPQFFVIDRNETRKNSYNSDYDFKENIYAGYLMARHRFKRLMILGGLRYELTDVLRNNGRAVILNGNKFVSLDTLQNSKTQHFLLPQVQFKYALTPRVNLRFATTYTYSRPNYSDLIPSREEDRNEVTIGNPNLNYPRSTNVDVMIERYHSRSIFSAGLFYKGIEDFVFSYKRFGREGEPGSGNFPIFEFTKPLNGRNAQVFGAEFQAQFKFDFLTGFLSRIGIFSNYTFTDANAYIPKRVPANYAEAIIINPLEDDLSVFFEQDGSERISLPGQATHAANVGLFYDYKKIFIRLSSNYQSDFLMQIGPDPDFDVYYDAALRLDLTANYSIRKNFNVFIDCINITDTPLRYYIGEQSNIQKLEYYSWYTRFGLRLTY